MYKTTDLELPIGAQGAQLKAMTPLLPESSVADSSSGRGRVPRVPIPSVTD